MTHHYRITTPLGKIVECPLQVYANGKTNVSWIAYVAVALGAKLVEVVL